MVRGFKVGTDVFLSRRGELVDDVDSRCLSLSLLWRCLLVEHLVLETYPPPLFLFEPFLLLGVRLSIAIFEDLKGELNQLCDSLVVSYFTVRAWNKSQLFVLGWVMDIESFRVLIVYCGILFGS